MERPRDWDRVGYRRPTAFRKRPPKSDSGDCSSRTSAPIRRAMTPKILLTGKNGQVGRELNALLPRFGDVVALDRSGLNLSNPWDVREAIRTVRPRLIVNAAAYTAVDQA